MYMYVALFTNKTKKNRKTSRRKLQIVSDSSLQREKKYMITANIHYILSEESWSWRLTYTFEVYMTSNQYDAYTLQKPFVFLIPLQIDLKKRLCCHLIHSIVSIRSGRFCRCTQNVPLMIIYISILFISSLFFHSLTNWSMFKTRCSNLDIIEADHERINYFFLCK